MADNETTADIIAAMRFDATTRDQYDSAYIVGLCDRIEAAHRRDAVTDCNQLREALVKARRFIYSSPLMSIVDNTGTIARGELCAEIDAALAAPPRNCNRFATVDEARKAHEAICEKYVKCHNGCPLNNEEHYSAFDCFEAWLFAPATEKEGGNDDQKQH